VAISTDEARAVALQFLSVYPRALELVYNIRESVEALYGPRATAVPRNMKGGYFPKATSFNGHMYRGRVDVPAENIAHAGDMLLTLRHEVLGHYGVNTFQPAEKRALLDGIIVARQEPSLARLWADVDSHYAGYPIDVRAEEVFALQCEAIEPGHHIGAAQVLERGQQSFSETCIARVRPMQIHDLHNIACMVAQGLHDRSRTQQNFPQITQQFRQGAAMEPKKPFHEVVAEKLIEQLKAGTAPWQRPWEPGDPNAVLPMNPSTGKRYKGINAVYLTAQGRSDSRWMTYKQAAAVGAQVRKGEKGTPVQYWKFSEEQTKLDDNGRPVLDADGQPVKQTVMLERPRVFTAAVFNAEQIEGLPPLQQKEQTWQAIDRAEHILQASGAVIHHGENNRAFYRPVTDSMHLPGKGQFPSAEGYYATALHELGHWTGHASRLDRDLSHPFGSQGYAKEELRAEIASMILGAELGIGHDPGQHAAYVGSWIKTLQEDPLEIFRASADAEKIQGYVLAFEQKQVQEQEQAKVQQPEQHYSDLTLQALVEKHGWEVAYTGLQEPGRVDSVHRTFEGVGPLGTMTTPNGERRLSAGYHDDAERRRYVTLKLGGQVIGDADGRDQNAEEVARQINARAEQYADERRVKNGLEPIYSIASQQAQAPQLNDELREHGQQIVSHLDAQSRWGDGERIFAFHEQDGEPHQVKRLAELESFTPDQLLALPALAQEQEQEAKMQAPEHTEAWMLKHVELGTVGRALEGASLEQIDSALDVLDRMQPMNTHNEFWTRHELPHDLEPLEAKINDAIDHLDEERRPDAVVAATRLDLATGNTKSRERDRQAFHLASRDALGFPLPHDWTGEVRVVGVVEREGGTRAADLASETPEAYHLYARKGEGKFGEDAFEYLTATRTLGEADELADRLALIDANSQTDEYEKATRIARVQEDRVRRDPNSTDEDISAAKEARKALEAKAFVAAAEAKSAQGEQQGSHPVPRDWQGEACRQFDEEMEKRMGGPYHEARELFSKIEGARDRIEDIHWDGRTPSEAERREVKELQSGIDEAGRWLHANVYLNPVIKERMYPVVQNRSINFTDDIVAYLGEMKARLGAEAGQLRAEGDAQQKPVEKPAERQYISVPFKDKDEAKQRGARWDRKEQSWYVPAGVDAAPFAKWAQGAATAAAEARSTQQAPEAQGDGQKAAQQARQYLAVPYEQRNAAKAAGALWDKAAKSWYAGPRADMAKLDRWKFENVQAQQGPAMTPREEFAEAMRSAGLVTGSNAQGDHPIMDGKRHRVPVDGGKKGALDGFYVGHLDGHPAGRIINNKTGTDFTWKSKGYALSDQERVKLQAEAAEKLAQRAAEQDRLQEATSLRVSRQVVDMVPVERPTPYLQAKGIEAHAGVFTDREGQKTYIPAFDVDGKLWTMQYIQEDGTKRFAKDSRKEGCFHPVGGWAALAAAPALVIAEGYATAASVAAALGHATVAAFDSGNLPHVARVLHERFPDKPVIIAGDDDKQQEVERGHNPGRVKADEAAKAVGGRAIFPIFAQGEQQANPKGFTDFNDLANSSALGREGVKRQVGAAVGKALQEESQRQKVEKSEKQQPIEPRLRRAARIG
jgi:putative DNA primase/helicase